MALEKFSMSDKLYISSDILNAIMNGMDYSKQRANTWIKRFIVDNIRSEIVYINGIPHRNREIDYTYIKKMLSYLNVSDSSIDEFFNRNFHYSATVIPTNAKYEFAETIDMAAKRLSKNTIEYSEDLNDLKELL